MGQLEAYGVNEIYLSGIMTGLCGTYVAEGYESANFESFKAYVYSAVFITSKKLKRILVSPITLTTNNGAQYKSWSYFNLSFDSVIEITKLIDDFLIWQDVALVDLKVDAHVLELQHRYSW